MDFLTPKVIETALVAFTTFFAVIGPIDVAAVYAGLTAGMPPAHRRRTAIKGVLIALQYRNRAEEGRLEGRE